jgi:hypothetical protein
MEKLIKSGQVFFGIAIAGLGIQQFLYAGFRPVILPSGSSPLFGIVFWACLTGAVLIAAAFAIIFEKQGRVISLWLGGLFLAFFCFGHVPFELFADPYGQHLGTWTNALKELALSGGAFVVAGSFPLIKINGKRQPAIIGWLEKLIPAGPVFFSITMICFGIDHFLYTDFVKSLVPAWIAHEVFWTYFAAVALIGSGIAIIFRIRLRLVGMLLGSMLFLWLLMLHIPRAVADPYGDKGNEITSVFEALGFSGIAFIIACRPRQSIILKDSGPKVENT